MPVVIEEVIFQVQLRLENNLKNLESEAIDSLAMFNKEGTDTHQENLYLRTKVGQLESQLGKSADGSDRAMVKELQEKSRKVRCITLILRSFCNKHTMNKFVFFPCQTEEKLNDSNLNLRIKTREAKALEEKLQWAREMQKEQRKKIQTSDEMICKLKDAESRLKKTADELEVQLQKKIATVNELKTNQEVGVHGSFIY